MSGHNRWSKIKHAKAATDAKRAAGWTKALREVAMAAKSGGDPGTNARLRAAVEKARAVNVPNDTIKRSIQKAAGEPGGDSYEDLVYEVYGPGGCAAVVEILTDNRNRTAGEIRKLLERHHGKLAASGSVLYLFHKQGHILFETGTVDEDALMETALEAGADDVRTEDGGFVVVTQPGQMLTVKEALEAKAMKPVHTEVGLYPEITVRLEGKEAEQMLKLVNLLEEQEDVQNVFANYEVDDALLEQHG